MRIVKYYENRQKAKAAVIGLRRAFGSSYEIAIYIQNESIWLTIHEITEDDLATINGILIHGTDSTEDQIPAIVECHEFYRGTGLKRFQPYYGRRR